MSYDAAKQETYSSALDKSHETTLRSADGAAVVNTERATNKPAERGAERAAL